MKWLCVAHRNYEEHEFIVTANTMQEAHSEAQDRYQDFSISTQKASAEDLVRLEK